MGVRTSLQFKYITTAFARVLCLHINPYVLFVFFSFFPHLTSSLSYYPLYHSFSALVFCSSLPYREIVHFVYIYFPLLISSYILTFSTHFINCSVFSLLLTTLFYSLVPHMRMICSLIHLQFSFLFCIFLCADYSVFATTCLYRPFCILERCLDSNPESCCRKHTPY
jgi:hypothetical protein